MMMAPDVPDASSASQAHLVVRVDGGTGDTNYTLMLDRPVEGRVRVREWSEANRAGAPEIRTLPVDEVYARLERASEARRRVNVNLLRIRSWLDGRPV